MIGVDYTGQGRAHRNNTGAKHAGKNMQMAKIIRTVKESNGEKYSG